MTGVNGTKGPSRQHTGQPPASRIPRPKRESVRHRLLDAALAVFASRGFDSATLDQVAEAAGLTKGAIYSNFASKEDLFYTMMNEQALRRAEAVRTALAARVAGQDDQEAARGIGQLLSDAFTRERDWQLVFLDFWGRAVRDDAAHAQFLTHRRAMRQAIAEHVQEALGPALATSEFTADEIITVVLALTNGLVIEKYIDPGLAAGDLLGRILERLSR